MFAGFRKITLLSLFVSFLLVGCGGKTSVVKDAIVVMGMQNVDSVTYSGSAWRIRNGFMQTPNTNAPWLERDDINNYVRTLDFSNPASLSVGETFAQDMFLGEATSGIYAELISTEQIAWAQQFAIWLTPWGFLYGAERNDVEESLRTINGSDYTIVSWKSPLSQRSPAGLNYTVTGYINSQNLVERVETWVEHAFMGDMHVEMIYSDYAEFDGLMVPTSMEEQRGNGGVFGVTVTAASGNPNNLAELLTPPDDMGGLFFPQGERPEELTQKLGEGVYLIVGGYVSLAVEFENHIVVFEGGQSEARALEVIREVKLAIPNKSIRYVVNSHPHSDHTAGLVPFIREGATIITHSNNIAFLDMVLSAPRTLLGEEMLNPQFEGVDGIGVYEDLSMRLELHHIPTLHSDSMLVAYLPEQKILMQADFTLPQPGAEANPFVIELAKYIDETGLDFDAYLAVHAAQVAQTKGDLMAVLMK